ncbi:MAG: alanine/ornithine racemase family PLP-dependent enzyme [Synergistaceae bacterium]|jgi:predicted amino acid racemase|nr:alanine/ornithine racemase family PLP-dependent enzyme [Synergistaceae bacterium]
MKYPALIINRESVLINARAVAELCRSSGIGVWGVTKGLSGDPRLAAIYEAAGFEGCADSRLMNLKKIREAGVYAPLLMMRIAMRSELEELAATADVSLQSEISTIKALDEICASRRVAHDVLLMTDVGDLREGFWETELADAAAHLRDLSGGVRIKGVATNFACASGVLPTPENMTRLVKFRDIVASVMKQELPVISVGGTCCLKMIESGLTPREVNALRLCEGILLGMDTAFGRAIPWLSRDALRIEAEIVECRDKPSVPTGETGMQAFGEKPVFTDRGMRRRAILAIGRQDVNVDRITPMDEGVEIVTASSDHLILDVTEAIKTAPHERFEPGAIMSFRPLYPAMLACSTSPYVENIFE